jgi:hypothetical protein
VWNLYFPKGKDKLHTALVHLPRRILESEGGWFNLIRAFVAKKGFWNKKIYE